MLGVRFRLDLMKSWLGSILFLGLASGLAYAILNYTLSPDTVANPNQQLPHYSSAFWDTVVRKGGHFAAFGAFAGSVYLALITAPYPKLNPWLAASFIAMGLSLGSEVGQRWVPGRYSNSTDIAIDAAGIATSLLLLTVIRHLWRKRLSRRAEVNQPAAVERQLTKALLE
nr:hypothetical protein [uncultured archaeon]